LSFFIILTNFRKSAWCMLHLSTLF
jgi:hypothetical protein